jgi:hypothetical protein
MVSGHYLFYSYQDEHFFFSHPHLLDGLFGFRKGWLIYTPLMVLAIVFLFRLRPRQWSLGLSVFTFVNLYVVLSWWCWWYGGSYGQRALIESYAPLSLAMASGLEWMQQGSRRLVFIPAVLLTSLTIYQTLQYKRGVLHYDAMTWKAYKGIFLRHHYPQGYETMICNPDYYNAKLGLPERNDCIEHNHLNP